MAVFVVLLGPPGVGKGTQAARLADELGLPHISSGELFRENIKAATALGLEAKSYIDRGLLVPDDVTIGMVANRLGAQDCTGGAMLDGFPRTIDQAEALDKVLAERSECLTLVPYVAAPTETLLARLGGRWTCRDCQAVYHALYNAPRVPGVCDACGGPLYQRPDDSPETHRKRIEVYQEQTAPLIDYYRVRGVLVRIDGAAGIESVHAELLSAIQQAAREREAMGDEACLPSSRV